MLFLVSLVIVSACSQEESLKQEQVHTVNSELISEYATLISQNKHSLLFELAASQQQDVFPKWQELSEEELEEVMKLLAQEFVKLGGVRDYSLFPDWTDKDSYDLSLSNSLALNALAKKYHNKSVNQLSHTEVLDLIDAMNIEEFNALATSFSNTKNVKLRNTQSFQVSDSYLETRNIEARSLVARTNCNSYVYRIRTTIGDSGNVDCIGYSHATHQGDTDCSYEFTFPYSRNRSMVSLKLTTNSWLLMKVLEAGRINGRYHQNPFLGMDGDETPSRVSFLIGKNRLRLASYFSPGSVVNDLKGSW